MGTSVLINANWYKTQIVMVVLVTTIHVFLFFYFDNCMKTKNTWMVGLRRP